MNVDGVQRFVVPAVITLGINTLQCLVIEELKDSCNLSGCKWEPFCLKETAGCNESHHPCPFPQMCEVEGEALCVHECF